MKLLTVTTAIVVAGSAYARPDCDRANIIREGRVLGRQAARIEQLAAGVPAYRRVRDEADAFRHAVDRLTDGAAANAACHRLERELERDLRPALDQLQDAEARAQAIRPAPQIGQTMERLSVTFERFAEAIYGIGIGPVPGPGRPPVIVPVPPVFPPRPPLPPIVHPPRPPMPSPCQRVVGTYTGVCRASAGVTAISFQVVNTGSACVATNATYFAPLALLQSGASFVGAPVSNGSVAIRDTRLVVSGAGQFVFTGYNYAGRFWFQCTPH
jgi:hypothetical protein